MVSQHADYAEAVADQVQRSSSYQKEHEANPQTLHLGIQAAEIDEIGEARIKGNKEARDGNCTADTKLFSMIDGYAKLGGQWKSPHRRDLWFEDKPDP